MNWFSIANAYLEQPDGGFVLVSMVAKKGSSYLLPGARMLVHESGVYHGAISAGCLEEKVAASALECLAQGRNQLETIDTRLHYGCYGEITLLYEVLPDRPYTESLMRSVLDAGKLRKPVQVFTCYADLEATHLTGVGDWLGERDCLVEKIEPPVRLLVFGDWQDGRAIAGLALKLDWQVEVIDTRDPAFSAVHSLGHPEPDGKTAVLLATHYLARDVVCLRALLGKGLGYVGVIGSRSRREALADELMALGDLSVMEAFESVRCPAGLDLGGRGSGAIALSVVSEIQSVFQSKDQTDLVRQRL